VRRVALLATAASVYVLAAWTVAPGFYDFSIPVTPYAWVCPPSGLSQGNIPPTSGHADIPVTNGANDITSVTTDDGQLSIGFLSGVFDAVGKSVISVDIAPVSPCPQPALLHLATNAYLIIATAPLVKNANLVLRYSDRVPSPSDVYYATSLDGPWTSIGAAPTAQPYTINTTTNKLGYFAAGYPANSISSSPNSASQLLPIAVAVLIVGVLVASVPLALMRRRRAAGGVDESDEEDE
jgi:hypothetical protein